MTRRAVFLDRDGVLNEPVVREGKPYPPPDLDHFKLFPDTMQALERLRSAGFALIVVTNQPDVARGLQSHETLEAIHRHLRALLPLDGIEVCCDEHSDRYKPQPGMLLRAAREHAIDLTRSWMVGDRWRDIDCGRAAGCFTIHIDRGYAEPLRMAPHATCADLTAAVDFILAHNPSPTITGASP